MGAMDRDWAREDAHRRAQLPDPAGWSVGELGELRRDPPRGGAPSSYGRPASEPRQQTSAAEAVAWLVFLVGLGVFFTGAFWEGHLPVWLTWAALAIALLSGLTAQGMDANGKKRLEAERHAALVEALRRR